MRTVVVTHRSRRTGEVTVLGERIAVADSFLTRFVGLMGRRTLAPNTGLLIQPSSGIHTCWMRMPIDVLALDRDHRILHIGHTVKPWRISGLGLRTRSVLELPAGLLRTRGVALGDAVEINLPA